MEATAVSLIGIGILALLGVQNSLVLAFGNKSLQKKNSACNRINHSPYAFIGKIPIAYLAALVYGGILGQVLQVFHNGDVEWTGISISIILVILVSGYYAYLLFFKLHLFCMICVRLYILNALMGLFLVGHHWYG